MNRTDKVFIGFVVICSIVLFFSTSLLTSKINADQAYATVLHRDREVMRIKMNQNGLYSLQGDLGPMLIEVRDGAIRVKEEVSSLNYCSLQGWVSKTNTPIFCLPNSVIIQVQNSDDGEVDVNIR